MTKLRVLRGVVDPVLSRWALNASHTHPCKTEAETDTERKMDKTEAETGVMWSQLKEYQSHQKVGEARNGFSWSTCWGGGGGGGRESIALPDFGFLAFRTVK